jgi:hypothetical protein
MWPERSCTHGQRQLVPKRLVPWMEGSLPERETRVMVVVITFRRNW